MIMRLNDREVQIPTTTSSEVVFPAQRWNARTKVIDPDDLVCRAHDRIGGASLYSSLLERRENSIVSRQRK